MRSSLSPTLYTLNYPNPNPNPSPQILLIAYDCAQTEITEAKAYFLNTPAHTSHYGREGSVQALLELDGRVEAPVPVRLVPRDGKVDNQVSGHGVAVEHYYADSSAPVLRGQLPMVGLYTCEVRCGLVGKVYG